MIFDEGSPKLLGLDFHPFRVEPSATAARMPPRSRIRRAQGLSPDNCHEALLNTLSDLHTGQTRMISSISSAQPRIFSTGKPPILSGACPTTFASAVVSQHLSLIDSCRSKTINSSFCARSSACLAVSLMPLHPVHPGADFVCLSVCRPMSS